MVETNEETLGDIKVSKMQERLDAIQDRVIDQGVRADKLEKEVQEKSKEVDTYKYLAEYMLSDIEVAAVFFAEKGNYNVANTLMEPYRQYYNGEITPEGLVISLKRMGKREAGNMKIS